MRPLVLIGFMGAGKTTVGRLVAERLGLPFTDLDDIVEARAGRKVAQIFAEDGEPEFRRREAEAVPEALERGGVIALGGGAPIDDASWRLIRERSRTVYLEARPRTLWTRAAGLDRPLAGDQRAFYNLYYPRTLRYAEAEHTVDGDRPLKEVVDEVVSLARGGGAPSS